MNPADPQRITDPAAEPAGQERMPATAFVAVARCDEPIASMTIVTQAELDRQALAIVASTRRAIDASGIMGGLGQGPRNVLAVLLANADESQTRKFGLVVVTIAPGELASRAGLSRRSFFRHLARLIGRGIVAGIGNGRSHDGYRVSVPVLAPMPPSVPVLSPMPQGCQYLSLDDDDDDRRGTEKADEPAFAILTGAGLPDDVAAAELRTRRAAGRPVDAAEAREAVNRTRQKRCDNPIGYLRTLIRNGCYTPAGLFGPGMATAKRSRPAGDVRNMSGAEHDAAKRAAREKEDQPVGDESDRPKHDGRKIPDVAPVVKPAQADPRSKIEKLKADGTYEALRSQAIATAGGFLAAHMAMHPESPAIEWEILRLASDGNPA